MIRRTAAKNVVDTSGSRGPEVCDGAPRTREPAAQRTPVSWLEHQRRPGQLSPLEGRLSKQLVPLWVHAAANLTYDSNVRSSKSSPTVHMEMMLAQFHRRCGSGTRALPTSGSWSPGHTCGRRQARLCSRSRRGRTWASPVYGTLKKCDVTVTGVSTFDKFASIGSEQSIVDKVAANQDDVSVPSMALLDVFVACTPPPSIKFDASRGPNNNRAEAIAIAALDLCSDAPFSAELTRIATGLPLARMKDGSYNVGTSI